MKTRKIVLITADLILLVVGIIQIIAAARSTVKTFKFSEEPDTILIEKYDGTLNLVKDGENWLINNEKYEATLSNVDSMIDYAKDIVALDKVEFTYGKKYRESPMELKLYKVTYEPFDCEELFFSLEAYTCYSTSDAMWVEGDWHWMCRGCLYGR